MPLDTVTEAQAQRFMEKYLELLSSKTVSIYLYGLNAAFQQAVNERLFPYNPFKGVRPSKINRADATERRAFTVEEAQRLTEILPGEWPDMIRVCLYTGGQRLGDIATLQWKQIDMEGGIISMTTQKTHHLAFEGSAGQTTCQPCERLRISGSGNASRAGGSYVEQTFHRIQRSAEEIRIH